MDRSVIERASRGDEEAFASLARASADRLMAIAYRILRDTGRAEDAVQQALVSAWSELPTLRDPDRFEAWLRRLLVNACYMEARRGRRWSGNIRVLPIDGLAGPDTTAAVVARDELERGFLRLPADQRVVFVYRHYLGLALAEIAAELGVPLGTVKSRLHYATDSLRSAIEDGRRAPLDTSSTEHPSERLA